MKGDTRDQATTGGKPPAEGSVGRCDASDKCAGESAGSGKDKSNINQSIAVKKARRQDGWQRQRPYHSVGLFRKSHIAAGCRRELREYIRERDLIIAEKASVR
jgi:hypothetical protein